MKTLFVSTYYNNHFFIELQQASIKAYVDGECDFLVLDDSAPDTISILGGGKATGDILYAAESQNVKYLRVPQYIHENESRGGLVPNGLPASHPTERHRACLHWALKNTHIFTSGYDTMILAESDMLFRKPIKIEDYMKGYDIIGTGRKNRQVIKTAENKIHWPDSIMEYDEISIDFLTMYFTIFNLNTVKNLDQLNIGGFAGTDTGGKTFMFLKNNIYRYLFLNIGGNIDYQIDFFSKDAPSEENAEFVHFRAGTNWDYQSIDYYQEKLNRMLRIFNPLLYKGSNPIMKPLVSRDKTHTFLP